MAYTDRSTRLGVAQLGYAGGLGIEQNSFGPFTPPQTIDLPGVASNAAVGSISVLPVQAILLSSVLGKQTPGTIKLQGGTVQLRIYIGGVERTQYLAWTQAATSQSSGAVGLGAASAQGTTLSSTTRGRWTATFSFFLPTGPGSWGPSRGQTVLITDFGRRVFAGCIIQVDVARLLSTESAIFFNCTASDKTSICDHRVVTQATYPAGSDVADIFRDIAANWLVGEGISSGSLPGSIGPTNADVTLNYVTVTQAFDQVSALGFASWWVDWFGNLQLSLLVDSPPCPFALTETSYNWRNLVVSYSLLDFRNTQYVRSNLTTLPGSAGTQFSWTVQQPEAAARGFVQGAGILPTNAASVLSLTVNGVQQNFYYGDNPVTYDPLNPLYGHVWWMFQGTQYVYPPGSATTVPNPPEKPHIGDVVVINFIPSTGSTGAGGSTEVVQASSGFEPQPLPGNTPQNGESFNTCGSGIYENVEQVNDITGQSDLEAIAQALLDRYGLPPPLITFETDVPGAAVGQALSVNVPLSYLPSQTLLITSVSGTCQDINLLQDNPQLAFDGLGASFRWEVTAGPDIGDWVKWFESLIGRTQHPNPVIRRSYPQFGLAIGGTLWSGVQTTNPLVVQQTGKLIQVFAAAGVPPFNQDLYLDILSANLGGLSILAAPLKIPSNSSALAIGTSFYTNPAYVFANDILTPTVAYSNIGANPTQAGSVTLGLVIEY